MTSERMIHSIWKAGRTAAEENSSATSAVSVQNAAAKYKIVSRPKGIFRSREDRKRSHKNLQRRRMPSRSHLKKRQDVEAESDEDSSDESDDEANESVLTRSATSPGKVMSATAIPHMTASSVANARATRSSTEIRSFAMTSSLYDDAPSVSANAASATSDARMDSEASIADEDDDDVNLRKTEPRAGLTP